MPRVDRSALVLHSADRMYTLVNDVPRYPDFLPGCVDSRILEANAKQMTASLTINKGGVTKSFTTLNKLIENQRIQMSLVDGPFQQLSGGWEFLALDQHACKVSLKLEFEFSSKLVELAFGKVFHQLADTMVRSFTSRANEVYGV